MSSTPTTRNGLDKQAYGDNPDLWGIQNLNTDLDLIDESLDGVTSVSTTGGTTTLSATNYATNQARKRVLVLSGVLVSAATIVIPNVEKWYIVKNITTGAYSVTINTAAGTGAVVTQGCTWMVRCDGSGAGTVTIVTPPVNLLPAASGTLDMNGQKITNLLAATVASDAARFDQLPGPAWYSSGGTKTSDFSFVVDTEYVIDTTGGNVKAYGPSAASARNKARFVKVGTGVFTINWNSLNYNGSSSDVSASGEGIEEVEYSGVAARGWTDI